MMDSNNKPNYVIATTGDYERLVPFFVANDLEFPDEEDYEVPTDLVLVLEGDRRCTAGA